MKVFGLWERLTKIIFFKGQQISIDPASQNTEAKTITIPDMVPSSQEMVLADQSQTLTNKTLSGGTLSGTIAGTPTFSGATVTFSGDVAVNGGDITTSNATATLLNSTATNVSIAGAATTLAVGNTATAAQTVNMFTASTGASTYNVASGATTTGLTKTVNLATNGASGSTTNVNIGATAGGGTTTINNTTVVSVASGKTVTALKVTQLGTGDALVVEDEASETSVTRITNDGKLGIGVGPAASLTNQLTVDGGDVLVSAGDIKLATTKGLQANAASSTLNIGTTSNAATLNIGIQTADAQTVNIATGATSSGVTKAINIGTNGNAGSTTNINIGTANGGTTTVNNNLVVAGNLEINGTTTTVNTATLEVEDQNVLLNKNGTDASAAGAGFTVQGTSAALASVQYDSALISKFKAGTAGSESEIITAAGTQTLTGNKTLSGTTTLSGASVVLASTSTVGPTATTATTTNLVNAATASGSTKAINIGGSGVSGSTTNIVLGSAVSGAVTNVTINGNQALTLPVGTTAQRPGTPAKGMVRYNDTDDVFEGYNEVSGWGVIGGGGTTDRITQATSFAIGDVLYLNGSNYEKAKADAANTAEVVGVVSKIITAGSSYEITLVGEVAGFSSLTPGEVYFLDPSTAGAITAVEPSVVGQVSVPIGVASSASTLYVAPKRGVVVGGANLRTQIGLANNTTTNIQNITSYTAGEIAGWVYIDATTDLRFYVQAQFVKDAANTWKVAFQTTGDTPPAGFKIDAATVASVDYLQVTMPNVTGFNAATSNINFALNAPAVGTSLPLQINSSNITWQSDQTFRNRIINGDMRISQRYDNVSAHTITTGQIFYTIDRFFVLAAGANVTGQRIAGTGVNPYVYRVTGAASNTQCLLIQRIEAANIEDLSNKVVTLQFEASATGITSLDYDIRVASARDNFGSTTSVTSGTVTISTTPTIFTVTATLPAGASNGVQINIGKTAGLVASQTFSISGVQLEAGPVATSFERRPYSLELQMCQRYFYKITGSAYTNFGIATVRATDLTRAYLRVQFPVSMRTLPNFSNNGNIGTINASRSLSSIGTPDLNQTTTLFALHELVLSSGWTEGLSFAVGSQNDTTAAFVYSAELI